MSYKNYSFKARSIYLLFVNLIATQHLLFLAYVNHLSIEYNLSLIISTAICSASLFSLITLNIYTLYSLAASLIFIFIVPSPETDPLLYILMLFTILPTIYIPFRYKFLLESELEKHNDELENKVQSRTKELSLAKEKAEKSEQVKSIFLATMSHELRTPLNSIIGFTSIIKQNEMSEENKMFIDAISKSGKDLLLLVNDVLSFTKLGKGYLKIAKIDFSLEELLASIESIANILILKKKKVIAFHYSLSNIDFIKGDENRLKQILENFVSNSVKFTESGEIHLNVKLLSQQKIEFSISDTGIGIESDKIDEIFDSFVQADSGINRKYGGTGLGLAISKKLIELMNGEIHVESNTGENHGSTFTFTIPYYPAEKHIKPSLEMIT
ncbi:MAG: ATP-binding protein [Spirochaetia bacterium]|nr:ATP-binding protein [Spirochaetia bacterium]